MRITIAIESHARSPPPPPPHDHRKPIRGVDLHCPPPKMVACSLTNPSPAPSRPPSLALPPAHKINGRHRCEAIFLPLDARHIPRCCHQNRAAARQREMRITIMTSCHYHNRHALSRALLQKAPSATDRELTAYVS
eukprot:IDg22412t1